MSASWKSPSLVPPSPTSTAATRSLAPQLGGQRQPVGDRQHGAQVADHPDDVVVEGAEVEGAVAAPGEAAVPAQQLAEQAAEVEAPRR